MKLNKSTLIGSIAGMVLIIGAVGGAVALAQSPTSTSPDVQGQIENPAYSGSIGVDQARTEGMGEADEAAALQEQAGITADQAVIAAKAANSGVKATRVEPDNENGVLVYSVELDNGLDVKVDAGNSSILRTEQAGENNEAGEIENDNVQEEVESQGQPDDANEAPSAEDAPAK